MKTYKIPNAPEGHPELPVYRFEGKECVLTLNVIGIPKEVEERVGIIFLENSKWLTVDPKELIPVPWPEDGDLVVVLNDDASIGFGTISAGGKRAYYTDTNQPHTPEYCRIFLPPKGHVLTGENLRREWLEANAKEWEVI